MSGSCPDGCGAWDFASRRSIHAPAGEQRIGPTAAYLLGRRPCRVIIETDNRPTPRREGVPVPA
jgi:hypothetical protein